MNKIVVTLKENSYPVVIDPSFSPLRVALKQTIASARPLKALVVTHPFLRDHFGSQIRKCLEGASLQVSFAELPCGEKIKNLEIVSELYHKCAENKLDRSSYIVAFGGGVIGDTAGFLAATYLRGINLIYFPTTLLGMVDSSIGGKVGVDLPWGKNLVGAFYQPKFVGIALSTLETLPIKEYRNGIAEVIKYGVISDRALFEMLEGDIPARLNLEWVVSRCAQIKAQVVSRDEKERIGLREILNFGHTIGHAIEALTQYKEYKHGEAIAVGMCGASFMAKSLGLWEWESHMRLEKLIDRAGLPIKLKRPLPVQVLLKLLYRDKKVYGQTLRFVLPIKIGRAILKEVTSSSALEGIRYIQS